MKADILKVFGSTVRKLRLSKKLSQEQLAELTGFHRTYIGMVERGERNLSLKSIKTFSDAFEINITDLFKNMK